MYTCYYGYIILFNLIYENITVLYNKLKAQKEKKEKKIA